MYLLAAGSLQAQKPAADTGAGKVLEILKGDRMHMMDVDSAHRFVSLVGKALVRQEKTLFYADSAVINQFDNTLEAFGNIHINDADSVHTYAQYLKYRGKEKKALLKNKVRLTDGKGVLTTDELEYDVSLKIGTYLKGGKLVNKKTVLTSGEGYYYGDTRDVYFKKKVVMTDPEYLVYTDTLQYNINTEVATFVSPTRIVSDSGRRTIHTKDGNFDLKNKRGFLYKRSWIDDSTYTFTADDMAVDDSTKLAEFRGNAVYRGKDTAQGFDLIANNIKTDRKKDMLLATEKPILLIKQGRDSVWVAADTLYTARLKDLMKTRAVPNIRDSGITNIDTTHITDSTNKFFEAYYRVRIFSDSLQAVGDSLFYSLQDSVFRLFKSPVIWAKENQVSGDTIYLYTANKKPERMRVFENSMAISRVDSTAYFNQLRANTINAWFMDGKINRMRAKGNAENVFYNQDDYKRFTGVSKSSADMMETHFKDSKPELIKFVNNFDGDTYPMRQTDHESLKLRNFRWLESIRPKSKYDILAN
ncbi:OstA-like protein [Sediminibacterium soli]|uniref:OstA-like protein n=1 Tax=Sediminibacterium soli TaxID=2698829 RepID=UPI001379F510|nr:OstA-like protein [Sediminibacterium soli]NCI46458.1 hypothetical protein [Sediminibacterium soli]